jgi:hypothetical protein
MPRRKPKHAWKEGQSGNPNGRPLGSTNQINNEIRDAFAMLLQSQIPNLQDWLDKAAKKDPIKALDLFTKISERFVPSLSRTEITSKDGEPFTPITISLPSLPQISVPTSIGEGAPLSLTASPAEEVKAIGEGTSAQFILPKPVLSQNQLRDLREMGMEPPVPGEDLR